MARIIITAQVEDEKKWLENFPSHKKIFKSYSAKRVRYGVTDGVAGTVWDVGDAKKMLDSMQAPDTAEAMAADGVIRDTVRVVVLDEKLDL